MIEPEAEHFVSGPQRKSKHPLPWLIKHNMTRRQKIAAQCQSLVGRSFPGPHVEAVLQLLKACLGSDVPASVARGQGIQLRTVQPQPADLIFFHNTWDENGNQIIDDLFTDTGVVVQVDQNRVQFVLLRNTRVVLGVLNWLQPNRRRLTGKAIENSYLRMILPTDPPPTRYLAGQLLAEFAQSPSLPD